MLDIVCRDMVIIFLRLTYMNKDRILTPKELTKLRKHFGERVRELRQRVGLSQEEFGFECCLHRTYIGSIERGEANLTLENIAILAIVLRCSIGDLFPNLIDIRK